MKCDVELIWLENKRGLFDFIKKRVGDIAAVEDIHHDVLIKMYNYCTTRGDVKNIKSWLYSIAQNTIIDSYKRSNQLVRVEFDEVISNPAYPNASNWIYIFLLSIPAKYSEPLIMSDLDGVNQRNVASALGLSLSATKSRIQRARKLLKQKFDECGVIEGNPDQTYYFTAIKPCCAKLKLN